VEHRQVCNQLYWAGEALSLDSSDRVLQKASFSFDASILEIFLPLACGARIVITRPGGEQDVDYLVQLVTATGVTYVDLVPALLEQMLEHPEIGRWESLRVMSSGAEALKPELVKGFYRRLPGVLWNTYGPTETTVQSTWIAGMQGEQVVPIGKPIANTQVYILDSSMNPVPVGVVGELFIGGAGVSRGYLHQPGLTAEKFLPDRFSKIPGSRLYRTGDLARWRADGNIEYSGRADFQVKIRGFRVELGEIEAVLQEHPLVDHAVVVAREDGPAGKRLIGYVVEKKPGQQLTLSELRGYLKQRLPEYLVPSAFVQLERLPRTPNGKLDRKALPAPAEGSMASGAPYIAPRNFVEQSLVELWENLLGKRPISVTENFFDLGGHSMLAVRLAARIEKQMGKRFPVAVLFQDATIESLARFLQSDAAAEQWSPLVPIQNEGNNSPLFFVHAVDGQVLSYMDLGRHLGPDQPLYGLQSRQGVQGLKHHTTLEEMAEEYINAIQTIQPAGPYRLGGWSMGGVIAFEIARQLQQQGQSVELLALVDSYAPSATPAPATFANDFAGFALQLGFGYERIMAAGGAILALPQVEQLAYLLAEAKTSGLLAPDTTREEFNIMWETFNAHSQMLARYCGGRYKGKITLFRAASLAGVSSDNSFIAAEDPERGWRNWAEDIEVIESQGTHFTVMQEPHVKTIADQLQERIELPLKAYVMA
jgi:thioesterase domain-containing protein/acyl carrier protein